MNLLQKFKSFNKLNLYLFIFLFLQIILSRNTFLSSIFFGFEKIFYINVIITIPLAIIFIFRFVRKKISLKNNKSILILIVFVILSVIIKKDVQAFNISLIFFLTSSYLYIMLIDFKTFAKHFIYIIAFLALYSLFTEYLVKQIIFAFGLDDNVQRLGLIQKNNNGLPFLNLFFSFSLFYAHYIRNFGIFNEPSYYQFYLNIALIILLFFKNIKKQDIKYIILFIITIFTTFSAAGYIVLITILFTYFIKTAKKQNFKKEEIWYFMVFLIFVIAMLFNISIIIRNFILVIEKITSINPSTLSRIGSVKHAIEIFIKNPVIGNNIAKVLKYKYGITNTTFVFGAIYGFIPFLILFYIKYLAVQKIKHDKTIKTLIFIILLLIINSQIFIGTISFWIIMFALSLKEKDMII